MIKIAILDDHQMFVDGISRIIEEVEETDLVGISKSKAECIHLLENNAVDILLNDIQLEEEDGLLTCKYVKETFEEVRVLMLTMFNDVSYVRRAFNSNADGYLLKSSGRNELLKAIKTVHRGEKFIDSEINFSDREGSRKKLYSSQDRPKISKREREVLGLILEQFTTVEIAKELFVSPKTIESHRRNLLAKFDVRNIAGLVRKTLELKIEL